MPDAVALAMVEALPATAPTVGWQTVNTIAGLPWSAAAVTTDGARIYLSHGLYNGSVQTQGVAFNTDGSKAALPQASVARQGVAGAWCNGKHYAIAGVYANGGVGDNVEAYTPAGSNGASGVWSSLPGIPGNSLAYRSAATIGTSIYVVGGASGPGAASTGGDILRRFDTTNNTWTALASMPALRTQGAMVAVGSKLYYLGGLDSSGNQTKTIYIFDTTAGTWSTSSAQLTGFVGGAGGAAIGSVAYVASASGSLYTFDTVTNAVATYSPAPPNHGSSPGVVSIGQALHLVSGASTANVDKLDLGAGTSYAAAVLGVKSLLNPLLAGVASALPTTPPTDTAGKAQYAANVQTLRALAAIS